jgi:hypothetical protein
MVGMKLSYKKIHDWSDGVNFVEPTTLTNLQGVKPSRRSSGGTL